MVENSKHVRVDNWGVFFLQRLQMFFSKTDFCDLTLQFDGNVQLKVHRLVMNACTEYFQYLESCQSVEESVILMPEDLQADVIVPIVNFMYTGTLQFQISQFERLYKAAEIMNITVLTKLLDAQKYAVSNSKAAVKKQNFGSQQQSVRKSTPKVAAPNIDLPATLPGRKLPVWKRKNAPSSVPVLSPPSHTQSHMLFPEKKYVQTTSEDPLFVHDNAPKPTRFEWPEEDLPTLSIMDTSFEEISYTSKPLLTVDYEFKAGPSFDDVKYSAHNKQVQVPNKKQTKPKLDMEEMKDYVKEQKIRSGLANYDDDEPYEPPRESVKRKLENKSQEASPNKKVKVGEKQIVHTKIISEILKKYPQLVKKNKNIRLKIMAKSPKGQSSENKQVEKVVTNSRVKLRPSSSKGEFAKTGLVTKEGNTLKPEIWSCDRCSTSEDPVEFVLYYLYRKHMTDVHYEKFDPLLCKYCGQYCKSHLLLTYHLYTKHAIKPASTKAFLECDLCPFIALTEGSMKKHRGNHSSLERRCSDCLLTFTNITTLTSHVQITGHTGKSIKKIFDCQYCIKKFPSSINLFSHLRLQHRMESNSDGIVSINENEEMEDSEEQDRAEKDEYILPEIITESTSKEKVKIISNVKVTQDHTTPSDHQQVTLEPSSESEALNNVASGIATSLGLVDIVVLDENQQYILQSNNQQLITQEGQQEFILPDIQDNTQYVPTSSAHSVMSQDILPPSDISSTDELVMVLTDHDYKDGQTEISSDNSNIVVLYSHPVDGQQGQFITSQGNLMVNSQTGLIEIRNGATITTTASSGQLVVTDSQDSHIESIEMIQREIESHNGIKNDANEDIKPIIQTSHNVIPPNEQVITSMSNHTSTIVSTNSDAVVMSTVSTQSDVDNIVKPDDSVADRDSVTIIQSTEESVVHEDITELQSTEEREVPEDISESDNNKFAEGETSIDSSSLIEEQLQEHADDGSVVVQHSIEEQGTQLGEPEEGEEMIRQGTQLGEPEEGEEIIRQDLEEDNVTEQEQVNEEPVNEGNDEVEGLDTIDSSRLSQVSPAVESMEVDESGNRDKLMECENSFEEQNIQSTEETQVAQISSEVQEEMPTLSAESNKNEESQDVPPDLDRSPPTLEIEESKSSSEIMNADEGPPELERVEQTNNEEENEPEPMDVDEQAEEPPVEQPQRSDDVEQGVDEVDNGTDEVYHDTHDVDQRIGEVEEATDEAEKGIVEGEQIETDEPEKLEAIVEGEQIETDEPEKLEDVSSETVENLVPESQQDSLSREEPETHAEINTDQADVNTESQEDCQQSETSTSQFNDENSQSSQESRISEQIDDESKKAGDANDATKISILNDWEDTDSQQSGDRTEAIKVAGETVNKLMDEWEEEEDADE